MTWEDPIVADVRRIREQLSATFNFDVAAIFTDIRSRQASAGDRLVHQPPTHEDSMRLKKLQSALIKHGYQPIDGGYFKEL